MANFLLGAALQGLGAGGEAYGNVTAKAELDRQKRLEDFQYRQELQREAIAGRAGGGGGGGKGFNPATAQAALEASLGVGPGGVPAYEDRLKSGSLFDQARTIDTGWPADSGAKQTADVVERPKGYEALQARGLADLKSLREAIATGGDYQDLTKGRLNEQKRDQLDQYQGGNDRAGQAALIGDGKDVYGGNSDVTRNSVTGKTDTTKVGESAIRENNAQAAKAIADAGKTKAEESAGGKAATVQSVISGENGEATAIMRDGTVRPLGIKSAAFNKQVADLVQKIGESDFKFRSLPPEAQRAEAIKRLTGKDPSPKPDAGKRPPLSSFMK